MATIPIILGEPSGQKPSGLTLLDLTLSDVADQRPLGRSRARAIPGPLIPAWLELPSAPRFHAREILGWGHAYPTFDPLPDAYSTSPLPPITLFDHHGKELT